MPLPWMFRCLPKVRATLGLVLEGRRSTLEVQPPLAVDSWEQ